MNKEYKENFYKFKEEIEINKLSKNIQRRFNINDETINFEINKTEIFKIEINQDFYHLKLISTKNLYIFRNYEFLNNYIDPLNKSDEEFFTVSLFGSEEERIFKYLLIRNNEKTVYVFELTSGLKQILEDEKNKRNFKNIFSKGVILD